jgi:hypothetical protein
LGWREPFQSAPGDACDVPGAGTGGSAPIPDQSNGGPPSALPGLGSEEWWTQRIVLAELVVTPPRAGDPIGYLLEYLPIPTDTIESAIGALEEIGLVERISDRVWATPAA